MSANRNQWEEWHRECELAKCCSETQNSLTGYVDRAFCRHLAILDPTLKFTHEQHEFPYSWEFFEDRMRAGTTRDGKRYKDALLMCGISNTVNMRCRDLAREMVGFTRRKVVQGTTSFDMPVSLSETEAEPVTLHDLLSLSVDPSQETHLTMLRADAEKLGKLLFDSLTSREKMALLVRELELNPSAKSIEEAVGCKKTMIYAACSSVRKRMENLCRQELPGEDEEIYELLTSAGMRILGGLVFNWGASEKSAEPLFIVKGHENPNE